MAVYVYSEQQIERMVGKSRRLRIRFCVVAIVILVIAVLLALYRPTLPIFRRPMRAWVMALLTSLFLFPLVRNIWRWRRWPDLLRNSLRETRVEVASGTVGVSGPFGYKRQLSISEVVRAEEPYLGTGLYLRTSNRYRWILIPRKLDGYEAIKRELAMAGAAVVKTSIPTNWEEWLFVLLFIGTMSCTLFTHNIRVLSVNLLVALLLAFGGLFIINSNPDLERPRMRSAKLGMFIPVAFAGSALWFALRG
jgi:hypothetical protein